MHFFLRNFTYLQINVLKICLAHLYGVGKMYKSCFNFWSYVVKGEYLENYSLCVCVLKSYTKILHFRAIHLCCKMDCVSGKLHQ